jgi:hypothetical protein
MLLAIIDVPNPNLSNPKHTQSFQYLTGDVWEQEPVENIWS